MMDQLSANASDFAAQLVKMGEQVERDVFEGIVKGAMLTLLGRLMETNPIDTARCVTSWSLSTDYSEWVQPPGDYRSVDLGALVKQIVDSLPESDHYVLFNNVEYLSYLEDGHSKNKPSGFIALALAELADNVRVAASAAGYFA